MFDKLGWFCSRWWTLGLVWPVSLVLGIMVYWPLLAFTFFSAPGVVFMIAGYLDHGRDW